MTRRSKLALIAFAALVLAMLWWMARIVNPVVSPTAVAASEHSDQPEVAPPSVEALPSAPDRALATGAVADQPAGDLEAKATPPTAGPASIRLMGTMLDPKGQPFLRPETAVELISASGVRQMAMLENGQYSYEGLRPGQSWT